MRDINESIEDITERSLQRAGWWAEPSATTDERFVVRGPNGIVADGLSREDAMRIASEFNLARVDAEVLAKRRAKGGRKRRSA